MEPERRRGPDAEGFWADEVCALGHGAWPSLTWIGALAADAFGCGRYVIVYNGEIYNFRDLRASSPLRVFSFAPTRTRKLS